MGHFIGFGRVFDDANAKYRLTATAVGLALGMDVNVIGPVALSGTADISIGGVSPDADALPSGAVVPITKLRLGAAGQDDRLVDGGNPMPTLDREVCKLLIEQKELLELILERLS